MKCAVYARVSTENDAQKTSIPSQIKLFDNYIKANGWELYKVYSDVKTGTTRDREGIQELLADAKEKKFDIVLAKEVSRLSRNGGFSYEFKDQILDQGIDIITLDGAINTLEGNTMNFGIYAWFSESEALRASERVKASYQVRARVGKFDAAPYGYDLINGKLVISSDESPEIVKRIFQSYIEGKSYDAIGRELFNEDIPSPAQRKCKKNANVYWQGSTVRQILDREIYTGCFIAGKTSTISPTSKKRKHNDPQDWIRYENSHEAIISKEDFKLVQQLMQSRKRTRSQQSTHLFTGYLQCGNCGAGMHFKRDRYVCGKQNKHGKKACSDNSRPKEKNLIVSLLKDINSLYFSDLKSVNIEQIVESKLRKVNQKKSSTEKLQSDIDNLKEKKQKALNKLLDDKIDQDAYDGLIAKINPAIEDLTKQLSELETEATLASGNIEDLKEYVLKQLKISEPITELTPSILARFIHKIIVKADGQLEVHYRTSKPSAFYVSSNIKLDIPKTHPNKAYVEKHA